jgi:hypothetical protein
MLVTEGVGELPCTCRSLFCVASVKVGPAGLWMLASQNPCACSPGSRCQFWREGLNERREHSSVCVQARPRCRTIIKLFCPLHHFLWAHWWLISKHECRTKVWNIHCAWNTSGRQCIDKHLPILDKSSDKNMSVPCTPKSLNHTLGLVTPSARPPSRLLSNTVTLNRTTSIHQSNRDSMLGNALDTSADLKHLRSELKQLKEQVHY